MTTCKNCAHEFEGNFCNNCGQKAKTARLNWTYLSDEAKYTFLHFNGGMTYSLKQLATRPGHTVRDFIDGKRVQHYKPILLLFVLAGIFGLLMHYIDPSEMFRTLNPDKKVNEVVQFQSRIFEFMISHYSLMEIINIPIFSLASYLGFRKWKYNFIEHVILNSFAASLRLAFSIAIFPLTYVAMRHSFIMPLQGLISIIGFSLTIWTYLQFFKRDMGKRLTGFLIFFCALFFEFLMVILLGVAYAVIFYGDELKAMGKA